MSLGKLVLKLLVILVPAIKTGKQHTHGEMMIMMIELVSGHGL